MYLKEHKLTHTTGRPVLFYIDDRTYDCQSDEYDKVERKSQATFPRMGNSQ